MPIEVHCPNPICARVHQVKDRYAGMRGKCPACSSWMYVPRTASPSAPIAAPVANPGTPVAEEEAGNFLMEEEQAAPAEKPLRLAGKSTPEEASKQEETESAKPARSFSRLAAVLVFLGLLALGGVAAVPFIPRPEIRATGDLAAALAGEAKPGFSEDKLLYIAGAPGAVAGVALLGLLIALIAGRFGFFSLLLLYLSSLASSVLLLVALHAYQSETHVLAQLEQAVADRQAAGTQGQARIEAGQQLLVALVATASACGLLLLSVVVAHRRWWARLFALMLLGAVAAVGPVWMYRAELGIQEQIPAEVEQHLSQLPPYWR